MKRPLERENIQTDNKAIISLLSI